MSANVAKIERHRPAHLHNKPHFHNLVTSEGGKTIHLSGLVSANSDGELVGEGDLAAQMAYVFDGITKSLESVGADATNVVRQRIFIVGMKSEDRATVVKAMNDFYGEDGSASSTCLGIQSLLMPGALVEIDVTAVIDG